MAATQDALYARIDLELSWSEEELPQRERTKHVHGLHPYLGKFVPQLAETFLRRLFRPGQVVYDPFSGSGTTLVEANALGLGALGCDVSAFNCLLARVKTAAHPLASVELALRGALEVVRRGAAEPPAAPSEWARAWYAPRALAELVAFRDAVAGGDAAARDVGAIVLSRAARSARLVSHFDLDFPKRPVLEPYWCYKHRRVCRPVGEAMKFLRRYTDDTLTRLRAFAPLRTDAPVCVLHADARTAELPLEPAGVVTSPPYPGLIDYHEQHRYAYELLRLGERRSLEIGSATEGISRRALQAYVESMTRVLVNARRFVGAGAPVVIVVNDSRGLYPAILAAAGLELVERTARHVNRRTGRRRGEFFEDVLVCRTV